jgi:hypothetical protein
MKIAVFWVVAPCSLVEVYQRFRGPCYNPEDSNLPTSYFNFCTFKYRTIACILRVAKAKYLFKLPI